MARCSSCGANIYWARTKSGAAMPLDPEPVPGGNVDWPGPAHPAAIVRAEKTVRRHVTHYVTCPAAAKHRAEKGVRLRMTMK